MPTSVPKQEHKARVHGITWTLFNYEPYVEDIKAYAKDHAAYMIFGYEICPDTGRKHLQGYTYYKNAVTYPNKRWRSVCDLETNGRDFRSNGSPQQNFDYCSKLGEFWEYGELPKQGERTDWAAAVNHLQAGTDIATVVEEQPQLLSCVRALERFQSLRLKPLHRDVTVILITGRSGTGKTRWAYDTYPELYSKPSGPWWDGYTGQKTILLDDYYGDMPYDQLLRVLDRYPVNLPVKGGFVWGQYTTVIITSNSHPNLWYSNGPTPKDISALMRRISSHRNIHNHAIEEIHSPPPPPPPPPSCDHSSAGGQEVCPSCWKRC